MLKLSTSPAPCGAVARGAGTESSQKCGPVCATARHPALAMIHVDNLCKAFRDLRRGQVLAVDHVSFDAHAGEVFGLLGPNGAGKTTAMRVLCTVLRPTGGTARVAGYDVLTQAGRVRQHIGFLSANTALYDRMSAWELVEYFGRLYGLDGQRLRQRMDVVFALLQVKGFRYVLGANMRTRMRQQLVL